MKNYTYLCNVESLTNKTHKTMKTMKAVIFHIWDIFDDRYKYVVICNEDEVDEVIKSRGTEIEKIEVLDAYMHEK